MAATPCPGRLSEQVPPRRLQQLVALDDPKRLLGGSVELQGAEANLQGLADATSAAASAVYALSC
jgi:hypothetical protein